MTLVGAGQDTDEYVSAPYVRTIAGDLVGGSVVILDVVSRSGFDQSELRTGCGAIWKTHGDVYPVPRRDRDVVPVLGVEGVRDPSWDGLVGRA